MWGVSPHPIPKAIRAGTVCLNQDGLVDIAGSEAVSERQHALLTAPVEVDPEWCQRIDAELVELQAWTREVLKTITPI